MPKPKTFWEKFANATIGAAMAESPAIMTASGWKQDKESNWELKPDKNSKKLADNLAVISGFSPTNYGTAAGNAMLRSVGALATNIRGLGKIDSLKLFYYNLRNFYNKKLTTAPTTYFDSAKNRQVTKFPKTQLIHQDNNISNLDKSLAYISSDLKIHPRLTIESFTLDSPSDNLVWWLTNRPYYQNEFWERIIKIPKNKVKTSPVSESKPIYDRIETSKSADISDAEMFLFNPFFRWYETVKFKKNGGIISKR